MSEREPCRVRITFRKEEPIKYISHLDLLRAWERMLRRAMLPVAYSQGFNPHPRITIAMPLPVGCTGEREVIDVILDEPASTESIVRTLNRVAPKGLCITGARLVPLKSPAMPNLIRQAMYQVTVSGLSQSAVEGRIGDLLRREVVEVEFRRKTFDLRPLIGSLTVRPAPSGTDPAQSGPVVLLEAALLRDERGRIGRPDTLLGILGLTEQTQSIHRREIVFADSAF